MFGCKPTCTYTLSMHVSACFDLLFFFYKFTLKVCGSGNDIKGNGIITGCL